MLFSSTAKQSQRYQANSQNPDFKGTLRIKNVIALIMFIVGSYLILDDTIKNSEIGCERLEPNQTVVCQATKHYYLKPSEIIPKTSIKSFEIISNFDSDGQQTCRLEMRMPDNTLILPFDESYTNCDFFYKRVGNIIGFVNSFDRQNEIGKQSLNLPASPVGMIMFVLLTSFIVIWVLFNNLFGIRR